MNESPEGCDTIAVVVNVAQDDIDQGEVGSLTACPIAKAVSRYLKEGFFSEVSFTINICESGRMGCRFAAEYQHEAHAFICLFDRRMAVSPFSFKLCLPTKYVRNQCQSHPQQQ